MSSMGGKNKAKTEEGKIAENSDSEDDLVLVDSPMASSFVGSPALGQPVEASGSAQPTLQSEVAAQMLRHEPLEAAARAPAPQPSGGPPAITSAEEEQEQAAVPEAPAIHEGDLCAFKMSRGECRAPRWQDEVERRRQAHEQAPADPRASAACALLYFSWSILMFFLVLNLARWAGAGVGSTHDASSAAGATRPRSLFLTGPGNQTLLWRPDAADASPLPLLATVVHNGRPFFTAEQEAALKRGAPGSVLAAMANRQPPLLKFTWRYLGSSSGGSTTAGSSTSRKQLPHLELGADLPLLVVSKLPPGVHLWRIEVEERGSVGSSGSSSTQRQPQPQTPLPMPLRDARVVSVTVTAPLVAGLDIGTSYACLSVAHAAPAASDATAAASQHRVQVVPLEPHQVCLPMEFAFVRGGLLTGTAARFGAGANARIANLKRIIGRPPTDAAVVNFAKSVFPVHACNADPSNANSSTRGSGGGARTGLPFESACLPALLNLSGRGASGDYRNNNGALVELRLLPEEIVAVALLRIKETAERRLGQTLSDCVVTVPAQFTNAQRKATLDAAALAGWHVIKLINEPTAAAFAYSRLDGGRDHTGERVLVFDFGGGTVDVSVVRLQPDGVFEVEATAGDTALGGDDITRRLAERVREKQGGALTTATPRAAAELDEAERAKRMLSRSASFAWRLGAPTQVTRDEFEHWTHDLLLRALVPVRQALQSAFGRVSSSDVERVLMVGGSSHIPRMKQLLQALFGDKVYLPYASAAAADPRTGTRTRDHDNGTPQQLLSPDLAVSYGAALVGARMLSSASASSASSASASASARSSPFLRDITPLPLGVKVLADSSSGDNFFPIIERNTRYPVSKKDTFQSVFDFQREATIWVYEGHSKRVGENQLVGRFEVRLPLAPAGQAAIEVEYAIDGNGLLSISATSAVDKHTELIQVYSSDGRLPRHSIGPKTRLVRAISQARMAWPGPSDAEKVTAAAAAAAAASWPLPADEVNAIQRKSAM